MQSRRLSRLPTAAAIRSRKRKALMDDWAAFLARPAAEVLPLRRAASNE